MSDSELLERTRGGDRVALARLLSLLENGGGRARALGALVYRAGSEPDTVGITGAPGAGKSTLTDRLVSAAREEGRREVAVVAVDPTSPFSGGAILGDRVRMQGHALDDGVFIRSMATRGQLGGLAVAVPEAIRALGAAGFGLVLVETVGVGQVEVEVAGATDTTVVVVNPGWGDSVQAAKAGLLEVADVFVVNKADRPGASATRRDLEQMLDMGAHRDWRPPVVETVGVDGKGVEELWAAIISHRHHLGGSAVESRRAERAARLVRRVAAAAIERELDSLCSGPGYEDLVRLVVEGRADPFEAAEQLLAGIAGISGIFPGARPSQAAPGAQPGGTSATNATS